MTIASSGSVSAAEIRERLVEALRLDLVGPGPDDRVHHEELIPRPPSRWYLTGWLESIQVPTEKEVAEEIRARREELASDEDLDSAVENPAADDSEPVERVARRGGLFPSAIGLTCLLAPEAETVRVLLDWGEYEEVEVSAENGEIGDGSQDEPGQDDRETRYWRRHHFHEEIEVSAREDRTYPVAEDVELRVVARESSLPEPDGERAARSLSLFLVNRKRPTKPLDLGYVFQPAITVESPHLLGRHDLTGLLEEELDDRIADLHYADVAEWAAGHGVGIEHLADGTDGVRRVRTTWQPRARVERVLPRGDVSAELRMRVLGDLEPTAVGEALTPLVGQYADWIAGQRGRLGELRGRRRETAEILLGEMERARDRIAEGIDLLASDAKVLDAFRIANRAVAEAAFRRLGVSDIRWRPFQLAFILLNLPALADPAHADRELVDLLFFPTGGGKTEAYLGLAAFAMVHRRLRHGTPKGLGLSVLMRYTLRLLTLDQLSRAAAMVCALELERRRAPDKLGDWPFEIGLWVGRAATPNRMGGPNDKDENCAYRRATAYKMGRTKERPVPLDSCPWCGEALKPDSFQFVPDAKKPEDLRLRCLKGDCEFDGTSDYLPILTVDDSIYRRVPAFLVATVDKFAALPWTGETSVLFGRVVDFDLEKGADPLPPRRDEEAALAPPDLVIQDELHLISGPLGTMVGLFETAIDALASRRLDGKVIRPKIVASTATVRRAEQQVRRLFARPRTALFPPPGIDRRDSFFAVAEPAEEDSAARLYVGLTAQGRGAKVLFLRTAACLLAAAEAAHKVAGDAPADAYMTLLAYFNALRELGSARRIVEGEVIEVLKHYGARRHPDTGLPVLSDRTIGDPLELTSRVPMNAVAEAKRRLSSLHNTGESADVALATNMISVGLDIQRLGLMVVAGQPKSAAEYIQATSRIGRDPERPGLVVVLLNLAKPRDRSHFEHFPHFHATFYRAVEATSVTPFAPPALDRGLAALLVALARHIEPELWREQSVGNIEALRQIAADLEGIVAQRTLKAEASAQEPVVRARIQRLLSAWAKIVEEQRALGGYLAYGERVKNVERLLREMLEPLKPGDERALFHAPRSMRDVEPAAWLEVLNPFGKTFGGGP
ncbi:MAG TPA: helicase [Rhodospirillales bacterium]|nr:helicase [Rhodospirillales bacterium]